MKSAWLFAALLALAPLSSPARAGGFDPSRVPADARWVAHLDIEAFTRSTAFQMLNEGEHSITADIDVNEIKQHLGLDPFRDLRAITIFSAGKASEEMVAVFVGDEKVDAAVAMITAMEGHRTIEVGGKPVHVLGKDKDTCYGYVQAQSGSNARTVIIAKGESQLRHALAVFEGDSPSMASSSESGIRVKPAAGSIVFAAATRGLSDLVDLDDEQASAVARLTRSFVFDLGESRSELFANLAIEAENPADALKIQQVFQGASALLSLVGQNPEMSSRIQRLTGALRFEALGNQVTASFRYPVRSLIEELEALDACDGDDGGK